MQTEEMNIEDDINRMYTTWIRYVVFVVRINKNMVLAAHRHVDKVSSYKENEPTEKNKC